MKRIAAVLVALALVSGFAFAAPKTQTIIQDKMLIKAPGSFNVTVGVGDLVVGGFEYPIGHFDIQNLRFSYGVKAIVATPMKYAFQAVTIGAVGQLHFALGCLNLPDALLWARNIDMFTGWGYGETFYTGAYSGYGPFGGTIGNAGFSYFFSRSFAVQAAGGMGGNYVGVLFKI